MPAKFSLDDMKHLAAEYHGRCLSKEYISIHHKLRWMCARGHTWDSTPHIVRQGGWCRQCLAKDEKFENMVILAQQNGGRLLSTEYVGSKHKLKWKCKEGHEWLSTPEVIKRGHWCRYCAGKVDYTIEHMKEYAKKHNGKCLSPKYVNSTTKLKWKCNEDHTWMALPSKIRSGCWCQLCGYKRASLKNKLKLNDIKKPALKRGGKLISNKYINARLPLLWECKKGHRWNSPASILAGHWCPFCAGKAKLTIAQLKQYAGEQGGKCLSSKYINSHSLIKWECEHGHRWKATAASVYSTHTWCRVCYNKKAVFNLGKYYRPRRQAKKKPA